MRPRPTAGLRLAVGAPTQISVLRAHSDREVAATDASGRSGDAGWRAGRCGLSCQASGSARERAALPVENRPSTDAAGRRGT